MTRWRFTMTDLSVVVVTVPWPGIDYAQAAHHAGILPHTIYAAEVI